MQSKYLKGYNRYGAHKLASTDRRMDAGLIAIFGPSRDKTCLQGFRQASFKPVSSATGTSQKIEISPVPSLHVILSTKRITKALIRLRGCAGWSAPVLFANPRRQVFSRRGPFIPRSCIVQGIKIYHRKSPKLRFLVFYATFNETHKSYFDLFITQK